MTLWSPYLRLSLPINLREASSPTVAGQRIRQVSPMNLWPPFFTWSLSTNFCLSFFLQSLVPNLQQLLSDNHRWLKFKGPLSDIVAKQLSTTVDRCLIFGNYFLLMFFVNHSHLNFIYCFFGNHCWSTYDNFFSTTTANQFPTNIFLCPLPCNNFRQPFFKDHSLHPFVIVFRWPLSDNCCQATFNYIFYDRFLIIIVSTPLIVVRCRRRISDHCFSATFFYQLLMVIFRV